MNFLDQKYKFRVSEITPDTKRYQELREQKRLEELRRKEAEEKAIKEQQDKEKRVKEKKQQEEQRKKFEEEQKKKDEELRALEQAEMKQLKGRFGVMINQLNTDSTPLEMTTTGLEVNLNQIAILVKAAKPNLSLKCLTITRKKITDEKGVEIAKNLAENKFLERLELEGNNLGPISAKEFASMLLKNKTLLVLDLEGNNLTNNNKDNSGIKAIAEALKQNTTLTYLNLHNTKLDELCSQWLADALEQNHSLTMLDIEANPQMSLENILRIQKSLQRNKAEYDKERFEEFLERKRMRYEFELSKILEQQQETQTQLKSLINDRVEEKQKKKENQWNEAVVNYEAEKQRIMAKLEREARMRATKKPKKPKKPAA